MNKPPVPPHELCRRLRGVMGERKMTRKRLAELSGISRPSLSNKLDCKVSFTYDELLAVIDALEISWVRLLSR